MPSVDLQSIAVLLLVAIVASALTALIVKAPETETPVVVVRCTCPENPRMRSPSTLDGLRIVQ